MRTRFSTSRGVFGASPRRAGGFTLAEALIASTVLAIAVTAITLPFASAAQNEQADGQMTIAVSLAQEMMEEIILKPFAAIDPNFPLGPEAGETRSTFNSIDDYNGYFEAAGNIRDFSGAVCTDPLAAGLSRLVSVNAAHVPGQSASDPYTFVLVKVAILQGSREVACLSRLAYFKP
jgi:MSHA pilin protein MshD